MWFPILATAIRIIWVIVEYPLVRRYAIRPDRDWDKYSARLWDVANLIEPVGMIIGFTSIGRIQTLATLRGSLGLAFLFGGITIRWVAIYTLGKYFTYTVLIRNDHRLIRTGLYKHIRHPSYAGALLAHLGIGLAFSNWLTLCFSSIPYLIAAVYRMRVEEEALRQAFGAEYLGYSKASSRLIPGVY
jgi:protein-S-isoprenylcysteine O-methyltransferase Ste14